MREGVRATSSGTNPTPIVGPPPVPTPTPPVGYRASPHAMSSMVQQSGHVPFSFSATTSYSAYGTKPPTTERQKPRRHRPPQALARTQSRMLNRIVPVSARELVSREQSSFGSAENPSPLKIT